MDLEYKLNEKDYVDFNMYHFQNRKGAKKQDMLFRFGVPLLFVLISVLLIEGNYLPAYIPIAIVCALWVWKFPAIFQWLLKRNVSRTLKTMMGGNAESENKLHLGEDTFTYNENEQSIETSYTNISKIEMDKERIYIYTGDMSAVIVPFSAFGDTNDMNAFVGFMKEKAVNALQ